ncbi:hypothetical protein BHM03_00007654 [Ensete ventricosum]|nr:hypothetical protein BHM03_00007654 [Ensete ventricosum]
MGAVGAEELVRWEKMEEGAEAASAPAGGGGKVEKIFVSVRLRPLSEKEVAANDSCDWECINDTTIIFRNSLPERSMIPTAYTFGEFALFTGCFQSELQISVFIPIVVLFVLQHEERAFVLKFSAIEIYNEAVKDLLSTDSIPLRLLDDPEGDCRESLIWFFCMQNFVDLAGSERASQALSAGARLKEGCHINRSLLTLGTVIRKLRFLYLLFFLLP